MNSGLKFLMFALPGQFMGAMLGYNSATVTKTWWIVQGLIVVFFLVLAYGLHRMDKPKKEKFVPSRQRKNYRL